MPKINIKDYKKMPKINIKDWIIIFFAVLVIVLIIILLTKSDGSEERMVFQQERTQYETLIDTLKAKNEKLNKEFLQVSNDVIQSYKKIDSLNQEISQRKPIIKYIIKSIKDEEEKPVFVPGDNQLDSVFTSELRDR